LCIARSSSEPGGSGLSRTFEWSRRISRAIEKGLFALEAQRIVDVTDGETLRYELFLRMVDRNRLIPAAEFVVEAERFGSIGEIDRWVTGKAIEAAGAGHPVDLNLSMRSADEDLVELIRTGLEETGADPGDLVIELSEAQLAVGIETRGEFVDAITELGCGIALDGYVEGGRGSYLLRRFEIDYVKLSGRFIDRLGTDRRQRRALAGAIYTGHRGGARVIAQGVESLVTLELLEDLGVDEAQGNALGPPEPLEELLGTAV
jgi:EAL domain-containing protein (putative c-di-GMP-specific phosphodiesterase class I)